MRVITASEIDEALTFPALVDALAEAFAHPPVQPVRHHHTVETGSGADNTLLLMPAWDDLATTQGEGLQGNGFLGVKIVNVAPDNGARGLPAIMGVYLLMDARLSDELNNRIRDFLPITNAEVYSISGDSLLYRADFVTVNKHAIDLVVSKSAFQEGIY